MTARASAILALLATALVACGSQPPPKNRPLVSGELDQVGVLTSTAGPQCTATVMRSKSGRIILTAGHCVVGQSRLRFEPRHSGPNPRFTSDTVGAGSNPFGVWRVTAGPYVDELNDYAFLIVDPENGNTVEHAVKGGLPLAHHAPLASDAPWTAYGYDVTWSAEAGDHCEQTDGLKDQPNGQYRLCRNSYGEDRLHVCRAGVKTSRRGSGSVLIPCAYGDYASGGPWINANYEIGAINNNSEYDVSAGSWGINGPELTEDTATGRKAHACLNAADAASANGSAGTDEVQCPEGTPGPPPNVGPAARKITLGGLILHNAGGPMPGLGATYHAFAAAHRAPLDGVPPPYFKFDPVDRVRNTFDEVTTQLCPRTGDSVGCVSGFEIFFAHPVSLGVAAKLVTSQLPSDAALTSARNLYYLGPYHNHNYPVAECRRFTSAELGHRLESDGRASAYFSAAPDLYSAGPTLHFSPRRVTYVKLAGSGYGLC